MINKNFPFDPNTPATESWWIGKDRATLRYLADQEEHRMSSGRLASFVNPLPRWWQDKRRNHPELQSLFTHERVIHAAAEHQ
jgi:hypothetical protein